MSSNTPIAIFMAATALLATNALNPNLAEAGGNKSGKFGGLKEWNTDQAIDAEMKLDKDAKAAAKKAKNENICIPIGEGENCW